MNSAVVSLAAPATDAVGWQPTLLRFASTEDPYRGRYEPSRRSRPVALAAAIGIVASFAAVAALVNVDQAPVAKKNRLQMVSLELLPPEPPPPPAPVAVPPEHQAATPIVAPVPVVDTPAPPPPVAVTSAPAPVSAPVNPPGPPAPAAPPIAAAPAVPSAGPLDGGDLSERMVEAPPPSYPEESRRRHEQGVVKLAVLVGADGRVATVELASSSGCYRLDRAALGAVRRWRWSPMRRNGEPVLVRGVVTIPFVLRV